MRKSDVLQRIPYDKEFTYIETKECFLDELEHKKNETSVIGCVNWLMEDYSQSMSANGMEKFVIMLASMIFMIENGNVDFDTAYGTMWDIFDFETGNYNDLFSAEDLHIIQADISTVKKYLQSMPKLVERVQADRKNTQVNLD